MSVVLLLVANDIYTLRASRPLLSTLMQNNLCASTMMIGTRNAITPVMTRSPIATGLRWSHWPNGPKMASIWAVIAMVMPIANGVLQTLSRLKIDSYSLRAFMAFDHCITTSALNAIVFA